MTPSKSPANPKVTCAPARRKLFTGERPYSLIICA